MELEGRIEDYEKSRFEGIKEYLVDTSASVMFYTPLMACSELIAGMDADEIAKSRLVATGIHLGIARPYGKFRQWWADKWNADGESSKLKKFLVDATGNALYQIPVYSTILTLAGASPEEIAVALPCGLTVGALSGRPYGYVLDKWRKHWGTKSTLEE